MRKYIRLVLFLVAFFSVIIMLIYRYKYHTLQSIINVMNFFPAKQRTSDDPIKQSKYNMTEETTLNFNHWTELFDGIYIYSAHVMKPYVFFLAYSKSSIPINLEHVTCQLWFESQEKSFETKPVIHYLHEKELSHFYFECAHNSDLGTPSAATFRKNDVSITVPIFHKQLHTGHHAACLNLPADNFSNLINIIEFLIYHSHIGIKHFLVYYTAFSNSVKEVLVDVARECDIVIEFLPWITPPLYEYNNLKLSPYFIDCMFHISSLNHSNFVYLLDLNEFLVLEETESLNQLVYANIPFDYTLLNRKVFCLEYQNDFIAEELNIKFKTLLKTKMSTVQSQEVKVIYNVKNLLSNENLITVKLKDLLYENLQTQKVKRLSSANVYSYFNCGHKTTPDTLLLPNKKMWFFKQALFESCIYKRAVSILGNDVI